MSPLVLKKEDVIGLATVIVFLLVGVVWFGIEMNLLRDENKRLHATKCSAPLKTETEECLVVTLPQFQGTPMGGAIFEWGTCAQGSVGPECRICGNDLTKEGRRELARSVLLGKD